MFYAFNSKNADVENFVSPWVTSPLFNIFCLKILNVTRKIFKKVMKEFIFSEVEGHQVPIFIKKGVVSRSKVKILLK